LLNKHFVFPIRVYIEDTDAGGIVYYGNYLKFMERSRTEFMRSLNFEQKLSDKSAQQFVVHSLDMIFLKPARMDMLLTVSVELTKVAKTYFIVNQKVMDENQEELFCHAQVKVACVGTIYSKDFKLQAMPVFVKTALQGVISNN
jgi:4-hydroxybenzoyl-CoA thioesterase/acyl-CoA thioester hydrolase